MLRRRMKFAASTLAVLALSGCLVACAEDDPAPRHPRAVGALADDGGLLCTSCGACEDYQNNTIRTHVQGPIDYPDPPPTGGMHDQCWASWGVHDEPLAAERWVHNLEHGGVVLLYDCSDGCDAEVARMQAFVTSHPRTLLTAYAQLPKRFAMVAWDYRIVSDCLDDDVLATFYAEHYDRGPESIPDGPPTICLERPDL
jgi:hypothetical protein